MKSKLDLVQLKKELMEMEYWHPIWKVVKDVLLSRGLWRNLPRGNSKKGFQKMQENKGKRIDN